MKKQSFKNISNPDELNSRLTYTSPITWISLSLVIILLVGFFAWSFFARIKEKVTGNASIKSGAVSLVVDAKDINKLDVGQKVYIADKEGEILSFNDNEPVVSSFELVDGEYTYTIVIKEIRPIDFLLGK